MLVCFNWSSSIIIKVFIVLYNQNTLPVFLNYSITSSFNTFQAICSIKKRKLPVFQLHHSFLSDGYKSVMCLRRNISLSILHLVYTWSNTIRNKFPIGHSFSISSHVFCVFAAMPRRVKITRRSRSTIQSKRERERERERERIVRAEKRCAWQISVCAGERQRRWKNDDVQERLIRARDPVIHHDPRLSTCHFRFSWRQPTNQLSRALRYRGAPVFLSTSRHTFRNCRRFNAAPLTVLLHRFVRHAI